MTFESSNQLTKISYYWVDRTLLVDPGNPVPTWSGHLSASLRVKSVPHRYKTGANRNTSRKHHWNMVRFMTHNYPSIPLFVVFPAAVNPITTRPRRFKVKMAGFPYTFSMWSICLFNLNQSKKPDTRKIIFMCLYGLMFKTWRILGRLIS